VTFTQIHARLSTLATTTIEMLEALQVQTGVTGTIFEFDDYATETVSS